MNMRSGNFDAEIKDHLMLSLVHPEDSFKMNWVEGKTPWGSVRSPEGINVAVERYFTETGNLREAYTFTNTSNFHILASIADTAIYTTFNDSYGDAALCLTNRCHAHIWCGGTSSWIMGLRMDGTGPHLGLVLTKAFLVHYSVERDLAQSSNDRGDFMLHPAALDLAPGQSDVLEWELFWHEGKDDFFWRLESFSAYLPLKASRFVAFQGESITLSYPQNQCLALTIDGEPVLPEMPGLLHISSKFPGERHIGFSSDGVKAFCRFVVIPPIWELAEKRCRFIEENQQYHNPESYLDGAYLAYDNEERHMVHSHFNDHNAGRERIGMGLLTARYLHFKPDLKLENGLKKYLRFILRELVDEKTGYVYNDAPRCDDFVRLYNAPWFARLFVECHELWGDNVWLGRMFSVLESYYANGGDKHYSIGIPVIESIEALNKAGMAEYAERLLSLYRSHASCILGNDLKYPAHEVSYEQSIVAPAAIFLLEMYKLTRENKYIDGAVKQLNILSLFNGEQPDGYMNQTAIRHWDGFWFGKRALYGDTFPHYWSALTGVAYSIYYDISRNEQYREWARRSLRGVLPLIMPDGGGSCARLHPLTVTGHRGDCFDPWANDQDWGLYLMLRYGLTMDMCQSV